MFETSKDAKKTITSDGEMAQKKAIELVAKKLDAKNNKGTDEYSPAGASYTVLLVPYGFDEDSNYEAIVCPNYYPLPITEK